MILHNEELIDLYKSPTVVRVMKSRWVQWAGMGKMNACRTWVGVTLGKPPLGRWRWR
jgi:carboxylesterase type B